MKGKKQKCTKGSRRAPLLSATVVVVVVAGRMRSLEKCNIKVSIVKRKKKEKKMYRSTRLEPFVVVLGVVCDGGWH
jgi:hypothetical protein